MIHRYRLHAAVRTNAPRQPMAPKRNDGRRRGSRLPYIDNGIPMGISDGLRRIPVALRQNR